MLRVSDVARLLETWAPRSLAWDRDNVGLQVGDPGAPVRRILVTLDVTEAVAAEAARRHADLIVAHHPTTVPSPPHTGYFHADRPDDRDASSQQLRALRRAYESRCSPWRDQPRARGDARSWTDIRPLAERRGAGQKIVTFVPGRSSATPWPLPWPSPAEAIIGNYDTCSFRSRGTGTFKGMTIPRPSIGRKGILERVSEIRLEMPVEDDRLPAVLAALRRSHPYEEVAYDIYPLESGASGDRHGCARNARRTR